MRAKAVAVMIVIAGGYALAGAAGAAAPIPAITSAPAQYTSETSAHFEFSVNDPAATLECASDGGGFAPCTSPVELTNLGDGTHYFYVRATNVEGSNITNYVWSISTVIPTVHIVNPPPPQTEDTNTMIELEITPPTSATIPGGALCVLDSQPAFECSHLYYPNTPEGTHTFTVTAFDGVGHVGNTESVTWTVGPGVGFVHGPPQETTSRAADFFLTHTGWWSEPVTYRCGLDGDALRPCPESVHIDNVALGPHVFAAEAVGPTGTAGPRREYRWTVIGSSAPPPPSALPAPAPPPPPALPPATTPAASNPVVEGRSARPVQVVALAGIAVRGTVVALRYRVRAAVPTREHVRIFRGKSLLRVIATPYHVPSAAVRAVRWRIPIRTVGQLRFCVEARTRAGDRRSASCASITVR